VLWVHGYAMDSAVWGGLWDLLPGLHHVGLDLPGHGGSSDIPLGMTLPDLAGLLADVARDTGIRQLVGMSFGSLAAVQLAIDHPELLDRLVLAAPTLGGAPPDPAAKRRYQELLLLKRLAGVSEALVDRWMEAPPDIFRGAQQHPTVHAKLRAAALRHSWRELGAGQMTTIADHRHTAADLGRITADTLVVVGDQDMPQFLQNARMLHTSVPRCELLVVDDAGHLPLLERPAAVSAAIEAHFTGEDGYLLDIRM